MTDDKKPREFWIDITDGFIFYDKPNVHDNERQQISYVIEHSAYDALAKENERLSKMLEYEKQREYPTQSQRELAYVNEITSLRESLAEYENLPSGMRSAKLHVENESLRELLQLAVQYLKEGKAKFRPNTTNSFVDDFIAKHDTKLGSE